MISNSRCIILLCVIFFSVPTLVHPYGVLFWGFNSCAATELISQFTRLFSLFFHFPCVLHGSERIVYSLCTPFFKLLARWVLRKRRLCPLCNICFLLPQTRFFSIRDTIARNPNGPDHFFVAWCTLCLYELWWLNNFCTKQGNRCFVHIRSLFLFSLSV